MIRNVVVHISNEQPLLADLFDLPAATDAGLVCTNLRAMDGKRPVFIDKIESTFFFPYRAIRFLEIPTGALERHQADGGQAAPAAGPVPEEPGEPAEAEPPRPPVLELGSGDEAGLGDEIDEDFLRRVRDI